MEKKDNDKRRYLSGDWEGENNEQTKVAIQVHTRTYPLVNTYNVVERLIPMNSPGPLFRKHPYHEADKDKKGVTNMEKCARACECN
jgi:hypothetical protein